MKIENGAIPGAYPARWIIKSQTEEEKLTERIAEQLTELGASLADSFTGYHPELIIKTIVAFCGMFLPFGLRVIPQIEMMDKTLAQKAKTDVDNS